MAIDTEIGRVVAVDTAQVTIELNRDLKGMSRITYEGPQEVGRINSYVIIPIGARRLVAMVTRVVLLEEAELKADRTMVALPAARRLMKATLIGTIDGTQFRQGVSTFPVLDSPVHLAEREDLDAIFGPIEFNTEKVDSDKPGFCIPIGESAVVQGRPIRINPDVFFGKHAAILGSTGSGKSCTVASIIQSVLQHKAVKRTTIVILDTNGEYRNAFQRRKVDSSWEEAGEWHTLCIPSDPSQRANRLVIPYWFLNAEDFTRLFRAAPGVQRPVLLDALAVARLEAEPSKEWRRLRDDVVLELNGILGRSRSSENRNAREVRQLCDQMIELLEDERSKEPLQELCQRYSLSRDELRETFQFIRNIVREGIRNEGGQYESYEPIGAQKRRRIESRVRPLLGKLTTQVGKSSQIHGSTPDTPTYFDLEQFRRIYLNEAMWRHESAGGRARDNCATMLLRIDQLCEDGRFEFLFGPVGQTLPRADHVLAAFLRDILGIGSGNDVKLSDKNQVPETIFPFYDRQRKGAKPVNVVIIDLSLLASEVLENVTALIGRLILEFLQRLGEHERAMRGLLPVVLVLEEAQNYIPHPRSNDDESISRLIFERIAREGRKYGLGLVVVSQRPSELSRTVLSQCGSFIVHRLQNPEDLRYFKEIVPAIYGPMLEQVPALAPQTALVLGECVAAPALVKIQEASPVPRSMDPKFYKYWTAGKSPSVPVEDVCSEWEGSMSFSKNSKEGYEDGTVNRVDAEEDTE